MRVQLAALLLAGLLAACIGSPATDAPTSECLAARSIAPGPPLPLVDWQNGTHDTIALSLATALAVRITGNPRMSEDGTKVSATWELENGGGFGVTLRDGRFERASMWEPGQRFPTRGDAAAGLERAAHALEAGSPQAYDPYDDGLESTLTLPWAGWSEPGSPYAIYAVRQELETNITIWSFGVGPVTPRLLPAGVLKSAAQVFEQCVAAVDRFGEMSIVGGGILFDGHHAVHHQELRWGEPCKGGTKLHVSLDATNGGYLGERFSDAEKWCEESQYYQ